MRALFAKTERATIWDDGATTFDNGMAVWDCGRLGARYTRRRIAHETAHRPTYTTQTTWDAGATTFDTGPTQWDRIVTGTEAANEYTANRELHHAHGANYDTIGSWKQVRWNLCGLPRGISGEISISAARGNNRPTRQATHQPMRAPSTRPHGIAL